MLFTKILDLDLEDCRSQREMDMIELVIILQNCFSHLIQYRLSICLLGNNFKFLVRHNKWESHHFSSTGIMSIWFILNNNKIIAESIGAFYFEVFWWNFIKLNCCFVITKKVENISYVSSKKLKWSHCIGTSRLRFFLVIWIEEFLKKRENKLIFLNNKSKCKTLKVVENEFFFC